MAERLIQEGMRWRGSLPGAARCPCGRAMRYSPATCFFMAMTSLSSSMHLSSVISMPQFAWIAGSFAHVTRSPCAHACSPNKISQLLPPDALHESF